MGQEEHEVVEMRIKREQKYKKEQVKKYESSDDDDDVLIVIRKDTRRSKGRSKSQGQDINEGNFGSFKKWETFNSGSTCSSSPVRKKSSS